MQNRQPYQPPSLTMLRASILQLNNEYKNESNPERKSWIAFIQEIEKSTQHHTLSDEERQDILAGCLLLARARIGCTYTEGYFNRFLSPERSSLFVILSKHLGIAKADMINDDEQFMYASIVYQYLKKHPFTTFDNLNWKSNEQILNEIDSTLTYLKKKEYKRLEAFHKGRPTLDAIELEIEKLCIDYESKMTSKTAASRPRLLQFMRFIRENSNITEESSNQDCLRAWYQRLGVLIYIMIEISKEYQRFNPQGDWWLAYMNGSNLFRLCMQALNINSPADLTCKEKIAWLDELFKHLKTLEEEKKIPADSDLKAHMKQIEDILKNQDQIKNKPGWVRYCATTATSGVASAAVGMGCAQLLSMAVMPAAGLMGAAAGPVGMAATLTSALLIARIVSSFAAGWAVSSLQDKVGQATADVTDKMLDSLNKGKSEEAFSIENQPELTDELKAFIKKWIKTMLAHDDKYVSASEKMQIRAIMSIVDDFENDFHVRNDAVVLFTP